MNDDIKIWKHFQYHWPLAKANHRSPHHHGFGHTHKVSAWNYHMKYDFCNTQFRENILELAKRQWNTTLVSDLWMSSSWLMKWKHFPRYWPFVRGIHRSPMNSPHKGQWRGALMISLIYVWINGWVNNREAGDLRRYRAHYDVTVMLRWLDNDVTATSIHNTLRVQRNGHFSNSNPICWM